MYRTMTDVPYKPAEDILKAKLAKCWVRDGCRELEPKDAGR